MRPGVLVLLVLSILRADARTADSANLASVAIDAIHLVSVSPEQITLGVASHVHSARKVTLKRIDFMDVTVNGIPVEIQPVVQRLVLAPKHPVALEPVDVRVSTREIRSLQPIVSAVIERRAMLEGRARMELDLNFLGRLFSGYPSGVAEVPIRSDISFEVSGGETARAGVLLALRVLGLAVGMADSVLR